MIDVAWLGDPNDCPDCPGPDGSFCAGHLRALRNELAIARRALRAIEANRLSELGFPEEVLA